MCFSVTKLNIIRWIRALVQLHKAEEVSQIGCLPRSIRVLVVQVEAAEASSFGYSGDAVRDCHGRPG
jgi:hypothetical protein